MSIHGLISRNTMMNKTATLADFMEWEDKTLKSTQKCWHQKQQWLTMKQGWETHHLIQQCDGVPRQI